MTSLRLLCCAALLSGCGSATTDLGAGFPDAAGGAVSLPASTGGASTGGQVVDARAGAPAAGGQPASVGTGGSGSVAGQPAVPQGGSSSAGAPASAGGQPASTGGSPACVPESGDQACAGSTCGYTVDNCGNGRACGTPVCAQGVCTANAQGVRSCVVTCQSAGIECGSAPSLGLNCGTCTEAPGGTCGLRAPNRCSYCADAGANAASALCPIAGQRLYDNCGDALPVGETNCQRVDPTRDPRDSQHEWCCS